MVKILPLTFKFLVASTFLVFAFVLVFPTNVLGDNNTQSVVTLPKDQTVNKDYFAQGGIVNVLGVINGDAYIFGRSVVVDGTINGDLIVAGGTVDIRGKVSNDIRVAGGQVIISGETGGNITAAGGTVNLIDSAKVGGSLVAGAGNLNVMAPIGKGANIAANQIILGNSIGGDVDAKATQLTLLPKADISGNLIYQSNNSAQIESGARVAGKTTQNFTPRNEPQPGGAAKAIGGFILISQIINFISSLIIGLLLIYFLPRFILGVSGEIIQRPVVSLIIGLIALIVIPVIIFLLFITIIGLPLGLILLALYLIALYLAKIFVSLTIGRWVLGMFNSKLKNGWALFLGLIIYEVFSLIPIVNIFTGLLVIFAGLGGLYLYFRNLYPVSVPLVKK